MMNAVVLREPRVLEYMRVPIPKMTREEHVLIRVGACGICGSDLRYWAGENPWALHTLGHHVDNPPNIIMGHEYAGVVEDVNSAKYEHLIGRRVGVQAYRTCGVCEFCRSGRQNICPRTIHMGHGQGWGQMEFYPGAYAEYCLGWGDLLYPLPDEITFAEAAMADILCVGVHAVGRCRVREGGNVLCIGGGPIGLSVAQVARAKGARRVFVADTSPMAREVAGRFDFDVFDPLSRPAADVIGQRGVSAVFDTVGTGESMTAALPLLEESGTYVNLAVHGGEVTLNAALLASERTITTSSNAFYGDVAEAYELVFSGQVQAAGMISHTLPLEEFQRAYDLLLAKPKQAYKVVFSMR